MTADLRSLSAEIFALRKRYAALAPKSRVGGHGKKVVELLHKKETEYKNAAKALRQ